MGHSVKLLDPFQLRLDIPVGFKLSPALRRLVEDVRREKDVGSSSPTSSSYDRIHSRHNRST